MTRMEVNAIAKLAANAEVGGYTLPSELTQAVRVYERVCSVDLPEVQQYNAEVAAERLLESLAVADEVDLGALVADAAETERSAQAVQRVQATVHAAVDRAAEAAIYLAQDLADSVVGDHLAVAYKSALSEVREVAELLDGHNTETHALLSAPVKVRTAYLRLPELTTRVTCLWEARRLIHAAAHRKPEHDITGIFASFARPMVLRPGWKPPMRVQKVDAPEDPTEYLLWLVSPQASAAEPWMPTVAEQDAAWLEQFGDGLRIRQQAHRNGLAVGARTSA